jgi:hypothetical protein
MEEITIALKEDRSWNNNPLKQTTEI